MTVSTTTTKNSYSGNGTLHSFAYGFKIFADADLSVVVRNAAGAETTKTLNTHYIVTNAGTDTGGNVLFKFNTGTSSDAHHSTSDFRPASGETVVISRALTLTQGTDYVANDPFPANSHENALDRLTMIQQQQQEELDRTIKASVTNTISGAEFTTSASDRANKVMSFDSSGNLSITQELGTNRGNWASSTNYVQRDIVKDTGTNNIFIVNTDHTSTGSLPLTTNTNSAKYDLLVDAASATTSQTAAASSATAAASSATASASSASTSSTKADEAAASAADVAKVQGITNGTVAANKAMVVDANKDISGGRNLTISGELDAVTLDISGDIDVDGTANLDVVDIDGAVDMASTLQLDGAITLGVAGASNGFINSPSGIFVNIDSDNNQTDRFFDVRKDSTDGSGTLLFQVTETGAVAIPGVLTTTAAAVFNSGYAAKGNCTVSPDTAGKDTFKFTSNAANDARLLMRSDTTTKVDIQANGTSFFNGGAVTMPSQPAFLVHPSSSQDNFGADGNLDVVAFGTERFDQGANFGSNVFTAPVAGKYHFDVFLFLLNLDSAASYYSVRLITSNRSYIYEFDPDFGQDAGRWTVSFSVLADMAATHTAGVSILQAAGSTAQTDIATESYFSGHLVA